MNGRRTIEAGKRTGIGRVQAGSWLQQRVRSVFLVKLPGAKKGEPEAVRIYVAPHTVRIKLSLHVAVVRENITTLEVEQVDGGKGRAIFLVARITSAEFETALGKQHKVVILPALLQVIEMQPGRVREAGIVI